MSEDWGVTAVITLLQWFNETVLRPPAVIVDVAIRSVRALYFGFRAGAVEAGADLSVASIISGFIVGGLLFALLWISALALRKFRIKTPGSAAILAGTVLFLIGCVLGMYFLGVTFYVLAQPDPPLSVLVLLVEAAILYPASGRIFRYVLGR
jgi:hypothetical protein